MSKATRFVWLLLIVGLGAIAISSCHSTAQGIILLVLTGVGIAAIVGSK